VIENKQKKMKKQIEKDRETTGNVKETSRNPKGNRNGNAKGCQSVGFLTE